MLVLATVGFLVNFWAWALISPLGSAYRDRLGLTGFQQSVLVAVPVVVGSLGRIPVEFARYGSGEAQAACTVALGPLYEDPLVLCEHLVPPAPLRAVRGA